MILVGEAVAEEVGEGRYRLEAVEPGEHRLLVYGDVGDVHDSTFATNHIFSSLQAEVMIDLCIETRLTIVEGQVKNRGGPAAGARVAVAALFLEATADKKGRYELTLPPGEWEVSAEAEGGGAAATVNVSGPPEPGEEAPVVELDFRLE